MFTLNFYVHGLIMNFWHYFLYRSKRKTPFQSSGFCHSTGKVHGLAIIFVSLFLSEKMVKMKAWQTVV